MSVALAKKLAGLKVGNILPIGSSGSGKTPLMRAVEWLSRQIARSGAASAPPLRRPRCSTFKPQLKPHGLPSPAATAPRTSRWASV
jgi:hypothetical protein